MSSTVDRSVASPFEHAQLRRTEVTLAGFNGRDEPVSSAVNDPDPTVRAAALSALLRLGTLTSSKISHALDDEDLRVRRRACELATLIPVTNDDGSREIDGILLRFLQSGDETMAELSAWSLGERHQQQNNDSPDAGENVAEDPRPARASKQPKAADETEQPEGQNQSETDCDNPDQSDLSDLREMSDLSNLGDLRDVSDLRNLRGLKDVTDQTDSFAEANLANIVQTLSETVYHHADALVREAAVAALGCIGTPEAKAPILHAIGDKATVRRRAVIALASFEGEDVEAALAEATGDRDWQVRQAAEDLLA